jgi:hypothetical protein
MITRILPAFANNHSSISAREADHVAPAFHCLPILVDGLVAIYNLALIPQISFSQKS